MTNISLESSFIWLMTWLHRKKDAMFCCLPFFLGKKYEVCVLHFFWHDVGLRCELCIWRVFEPYMKRTWYCFRLFIWYMWFWCYLLLLVCIRIIKKICFFNRSVRNMDSIFNTLNNNWNKCFLNAFFKINIYVK